MKNKLFTFILFVVAVIPNILFAQFTQQGSKLVGTGSVGNPVYQGWSVAISGDGNTLIEGAYFDSSNTGAAWIFTQSNGAWTQQGSKLVGTGGALGFGNQGIAVAISSDGNTAIVGGDADSGNAGAAWIFIRSGGVWTQQGAKLVGSGASGASYQGNSVALSSDGNTALVGAFQDNDGLGAAWVFTRSSGVWTQQGAKLVGTGASGMAYEGSSVALSADGNTAAIGGDYDSNSIGAVWIFTRDTGVWTQLGAKLVGTGVTGNFGAEGSSVALSADGNTVLVGGDDDNNYLGAAWVFTRSGGAWTQQGPKLVGTGSATSNVGEGVSVALSSDGNMGIVGGNGDGGGVGAVWVFTRSAGVWTQQGQKFSGTGAVNSAGQGHSVSIASNNTLVEGGAADSSGEGAVWVFKYSPLGISPTSGDLSANFILEQNYPNPVYRSTKIKFQIPELSETKISIYDITGSVVSTPVNEQLATGTYEVSFDGSNLAGGIYFYKLEAEGYAEIKRMILMK